MQGSAALAGPVQAAPQCKQIEEPVVMAAKETSAASTSTGELSPASTGLPEEPGVEEPGAQGWSARRFSGEPASSQATPAASDLELAGSPERCRQGTSPPGLWQGSRLQRSCEGPGAGSPGCPWPAVGASPEELLVDHAPGGIRRSSLRQRPSVRDRVHKLQLEIERAGRSRAGSGSGCSCGPRGRLGGRERPGRAGPRPGRPAAGRAAGRSAGPGATPHSPQRGEPLGEAAAPRGALATPRAEPRGRAAPAAELRGVTASRCESRRPHDLSETVGELTNSCDACAEDMAHARREHLRALQELRLSHAEELRRLAAAHAAVLAQRDDEIQRLRQQAQRVRADSRTSLTSSQVASHRELADALGTATALCNAISHARQQSYAMQSMRQAPVCLPGAKSS